MTKFTVFNDIHCGAPHELYPMTTNFYDMVAPGTLGVSIGDNYDRRSTKKDKLYSLNTMLINHQLQFAGHYLSGNHELFPLEIQPYLIINNVCFMHGDVLFWGLNKAYKWRKDHTTGAGMLYRALVKASDVLRESVPHKVKPLFFEQCSKYLRLTKCRTLVCGHFHPKEVMEFVVPEGRIIILPRGINKVEI